MAQPTGLPSETQTAVYNLSLMLNPIWREAPDVEGGGSSQEVLEHRGNPQRCARPSESAERGQSPAPGCKVLPGRGTPTHLPSGRWPGLQAGGAPGRGSRSARARAWPGRAVRPPRSPRAALRSAFPSPDQVVLSTLLPDSVLTGREPVFQGVTHL